MEGDDMKFKELDLSQEILKALEQLGYHEVYPVQQALIQEIKECNDILVQSATGSGKTAAYAIPIIEAITMNQKEPQALILTPTRELALQVKQDFDHISAYKQLKVLPIYGRTPYKYQYQDLKQRTHIICATVGRILDHIKQDSFDYSKIKYVVIDEADEMFNMGFIDDVKEIISYLPQDKVMILCSATLPEAISELANDVLQNPKYLSFHEGNEVKQELKHYAYQSEEKDELLLKLLGNHQPNSCIIFANTQEYVKKIALFLDEKGIDVDMLHGGMLQEDRISNINDFKKGKLRILVATDVAARGIDVEKVDLIINYELPFQSEVYIHRIGRSARNLESGLAISLVSKNDLYYFNQIETYLNETIAIHDTNELASITLESLKSLGKPKIYKKDKAAKIKEDFETIYIGGGKKKKIRAGDIVGALCGIEGVNIEDIGIIQVQDHQSYVNILNGKAKMIIDYFKNHSIKNKKVKVSYAKTTKD